MPHPIDQRLYTAQILSSKSWSVPVRVLGHAKVYFSQFSTEIDLTFYDDGICGQEVPYIDRRSILPAMQKQQYKLGMQGILRGFKIFFSGALIGYFLPAVSPRRYMYIYVETLPHGHLFSNTVTSL